MTAGLAHWKVVVPRGGDWGRRVCELLRDAGAEPVVVPLIEFTPPSSPEALADAAARLVAGDYDWAVFTSATSVAALAAAVPGAESAVADPAATALRIPEHVRVAAVGDATAAALTAAGVRVDFVPRADFSARALVDEWPDAAPGARVLVPISEIAAPTLVDGLRALGLSVDAVGAYRTVTATPDAASRALLTDPDIRAVLVTSGSVAGAVVELMPALPASALVACIGGRTAEEALAAGLRVDVVAPRQSVEALVAALADAAASGPDAHAPAAPDDALAAATRDRAGSRATAPAPGAPPSDTATDPVEHTP